MSADPARSGQAVVGIPAVVNASMTTQPLLKERIASYSRDEEHGCNLQPEFEVDEVKGAHHVKHRFHPFLHFSLVGGPRSGGNPRGGLGVRGPAEKNPVFCLDLQSSLVLFCQISEDHHVSGLKSGKKRSETGCVGTKIGHIRRHWTDLTKQY